MVVRGGEDYELAASRSGSFPACTASFGMRPFFGGIRTRRCRRPCFRRTRSLRSDFSDLRIEGGTLAYLIRMNGRQILVFGSMNYIEREVEGLRPDVVLVGAMPERREILRLHRPTVARPGVSSVRSADALGPVQRHVRRVTGTGSSAAAIIPRGSESRFSEEHRDRAEYFEPIAIR